MRFFSGHKWPLPVGKRFWSFTTAQPHCSLSQCCEAPEVWHHCAHPKTSREEGFDEHYDRTLSPIAPLAQASGTTWWESTKWNGRSSFRLVVHRNIRATFLVSLTSRANSVALWYISRICCCKAKNLHIKTLVDLFFPSCWINRSNLL